MIKRPKKGAPVLPELAEPEQRVPRRVRIEGDLRERLTMALRGLEDPRLAFVRVARVEMTDDLQLVRVFVHRSAGLDTTASEKERRDIMRGLRSASGRLRRDVGGALSLRYTPALRFIYDEGERHARRVDDLLDEIRRDDE